MEEYKLKGKIILRGKIKIETGLAIGGNKNTMDVGGIDSPVIKDAKGLPYIPGSSLKGKLRSLLEQSMYPLRRKQEAQQKKDGKGYFDESLTIHRFLDTSKVDEVIQIFGSPDVDNPVRGIFRDSRFDLDYFKANKLELFNNLELEFTEEKIENSIDRISARANPRHLERVPTGARFDFEIILDLYSDQDKQLLNMLLQGLKLLEDDYLGGSGTRGSGKIKFSVDAMEYRSVGYYKGEEKEIHLVDKKDLDEINNQEWLENAFSKISS